uniref:Uncharacterized protein n=1 Tax=Sphaerodactylus townsendi TaxID=933632 RepID=A0ACB8EVY1_9SAUR
MQLQAAGAQEDKRKKTRPSCRGVQRPTACKRTGKDLLAPQRFHCQTQEKGTEAEGRPPSPAGPELGIASQQYIALSLRYSPAAPLRNMNSPLSLNAFGGHDSLCIMGKAHNILQALASFEIHHPLSGNSRRTRRLPWPRVPWES